MSDDGATGVASATDEVHHTRRQLGLEKQLRKFQRRDRRRLRRLEHHGVSHRECGRDLPRQHQQREVPWDDLTDHSQRNDSSAGHRVLELVGPSGVIKEVRGCHRYVEVARFLDRLAAVHRLGYREFAGAILNQPRDAVEVLPTLAARQLAPRRERLLRRLKRPVDVGCIRERDLGQSLFGRRVDRVEVFARVGRDELSADEQAVTFSQSRIGGLGGWIVFPEVAEYQLRNGAAARGRAARDGSGRRHVSSSPLLP
jgi:hypothetical protein